MNTTGRMAERAILVTGFSGCLRVIRIRISIFSIGPELLSWVKSVQWLHVLSTILVEAWDLNVRVNPCNYWFSSILINFLLGDSWKKSKN